MPDASVVYQPICAHRTLLNVATRPRTRDVREIGLGLRAG
jgi:hypothetical protein